MTRCLGSWAMVLLVACGSSGVPMAPERSPHFDAVSTELQLGGTVYTYVDVDGDAERASEVVLSLLRGMPELEGRSSRSLSASTLARMLGLANVRAVGFSSYRTDPLFRNRGFIYHTGPREGLLRIFGGEPAPRELTNTAPDTADLVWEQQIDLRVLVDLARALGEHGMGASPSEIDAALERSFFGLDFTIGDVVDRLDTTVGLVLDVDAERVLRMPGDSFSFPFTEFVIQADGLGDLVDAIARRAAFDPFLRVENTERFLIIRAGIRLPPPWNVYDPSLVKDLETGRMVLASSPAFFDACLSPDRNVSATKDFTTAFEGLPTDGNGLLYLSPRLTRELHALLDRFINRGGATIATTIARFFLPDAGAPVGWVVANQTDGILFTSNSPSSHKTTLVTLGYAALLPAVVVLGARQLASDRPPAPRSP